ncbi:hypothetical protein [uncultured Kordia sp.]|uniref:hypothetical protein n=1 Tax=uncultured Kordia sp. TaxID=507699 RepID=UPI00260306B1|nr:hypothetical protein [uncultured Kordia sp.]
MKKLSLKKMQIAKIGNIHSVFGGSENSNAVTICEETGAVSVTCFTNCNCGNNITNLPNSCKTGYPSNTRPNNSVQLSATCPDLQG